MNHLKLEGKSRVLAAGLYMNDGYRVGDASRAADYGLEALQRWLNNAAIMYQTHRTLMWARRPDEAAGLIRQYEELFDPDPMMRARQACMEGRVQDVLDILANQREQGDSNGNIVWLMLLLLDDKQAAEAIPRHYESEESPQALLGWLGYHKFDPSPFPSLMAILERENVDRPPPVELPYTCPPP